METPAPEKFRLNRAYEALAADVAAKAAAGALLGSLIFFRRATWSRHSALVGFGFGFGYSVKEASIFLQNPTEEQLPRTLAAINDCTRTLCSRMTNIRQRLLSSKRIE